MTRTCWRRLNVLSPLLCHSHAVALVGLGLVVGHVGSHVDGKIDGRGIVPTERAHACSMPIETSSQRSARIPKRLASTELLENFQLLQGDPNQFRCQLACRLDELGFKQHAFAGHGMLGIQTFEKLRQRHL